MSWSDLPDVHKALRAALAAYDWAGALAICRPLIGRMHEASTPCPESDAVAILAALRRKRRFELMTPVAEALILTGQTAPRVRRQYAQALIDQGLLVAPEPLLQALAAESFEGDSQVAEAHGLLGRLYKQRFINAGRSGNRYARAYFERALAEYLQTYRLDPASNYWHGINVVALLHRGRADRYPIHHAPDPDVLAREIQERLRHTDRSSEPFELATKVEVLIALGDFAGAQAAAVDYSNHPDADAFEVSSTLRQFEEVWRLTDADPPGSTILPLLRAARLRGENGSARVTPQGVGPELSKVKKARAELERVLGTDNTVTLKWYETGLQRARSVARVERLNGKGHGTGWLVKASDFFPERTGLLLLTNAHVVNPEGSGDGLVPEQAQANFQSAGTVVSFKPGVVWTSPPDQCDATFLEFDGAPPPSDPMPLSSRKMRLTVPPPRLYIIGHPGGRDLELSLHDNKLLGCSDQLLHYRTPTEGGSSGSPVFDEAGWQVVGLHHAGGTFERLDGGAPPYEANEGISMRSIQAATRTPA